MTRMTELSDIVMGYKLGGQHATEWIKAKNKEGKALYNILGYWNLAVLITPAVGIVAWYFEKTRPLDKRSEESKLKLR